MTNSAMHVGHDGSNGAMAYTVICKSGQRGTEFNDPGDAALAFFRAREQDRPFVLRHRGNMSYVIASAKAGAKHIATSGGVDVVFRSAFESLIARI